MVCTSDTPNNGFIAVYRTKAQYFLFNCFVRQSALRACVEAYISQKHVATLQNILLKTNLQ